MYMYFLTAGLLRRAQTKKLLEKNNKSINLMDNDSVRSESEPPEPYDHEFIDDSELDANEDFIDCARALHSSLS